MEDIIDQIASTGARLDWYFVLVLAHSLSTVVQTGIIINRYTHPRSFGGLEEYGSPQCI